MRTTLNVNTHLGTILLIAPLAKAVDQLHQSNSKQTIASLNTLDQLRVEAQAVLDSLTRSDSERVYDAIRLTRPGGLGKADVHDVDATAPDDLRMAMAEVAEFDAVARQYVNGFEEIFTCFVPWLDAAMSRGVSILDAISEIQLRWLACECDGLIVRKAGREIAEEAQQLATFALDEWLETAQRGVRWQALDTFLRADGHKRNPGTTADLIAGALFVLLAR